MPYCLSFKTASPETSIGDESLHNSSLAISAEGTISSPRNASNPSPNFNLSRELAYAFQSASYNDIVSRVHVYVYDPCQGQDHLQVPPDLGDRTERHLSHVLQPNKDCVQEALSHAKPTTLTHLISTYFEYSENAARDCLKLYQSVHSARNLYTPLSDLLEILPTDSHAIDESQCNLAFDIFLKVDTFENPFSSPDSYNFRETQLCFSQLRNKLDSRLHKSRSRVRLIHHATAGSALCLVAAVVGVAASAAFIASHALPTLLVAGPLCSPYLPHSFKKKELSNISKLDAAAKGTFVLNNDLDTIICLVSRLHREIEYEKDFIRLGLAMGRDVYSIQEIVKNLRKSHINVTDQLKDLEKHICLWFTHNNDTRLSLLKQINLPQTHANL